MNYNKYNLTIDNTQQLSDKQKLFVNILFDFLTPFEVFNELSVMKEKGNEKWKIFVEPMVIFEDMLQNINYKGNGKIGLFAEMPEDNSLINEEVIFQKALQYAKNILWNYICGNRQPVEILN